MLAAGRTYGQGLARSTLSVSRCSRFIAPGAGGSNPSRVASFNPVSTQVARHGGGGSPPDDGPLTPEEQNTPWLTYQRNMYQRTGLRGFVSRRRRQRLSAAPPATGSATAGPSTTCGETDGLKFHVEPMPGSTGPPVKGETSSPAPSSFQTAAIPTTIAPEASTTATPAEKPLQTPSPPPPSTELLIPRSPWESSSSGSVGGSVDKSEQVAEMERKSGKRIVGEGSTHVSDSREAALNAELERKFGKDTDREPEQNSQGAPSHWEESIELGTGDEDCGGVTVSDPKAAAAGAEEQSRGSLEFPKTSRKRRKSGRRGGEKGNRDIPAEGGGTSEPVSESDVEVVVGPTSAASGDETGSPPPQERERSRPQGSGGKDEIAVAGERERAKLYRESSHYERPGSAWNNVHAKKNLKLLLDGLGSDYGVKEMLSAHHVSEKTQSKLLPMFQDLVLNDPNPAFDGKGCMKTQKAITDLCYHEKFAADAVLMRKPILGKSASGRTLVFPSTASKRGKSNLKRSRETAFVKKRNDLVEHQFIPRMVRLAQEKFPEEIEVAKKINGIVDLRNPHQSYPLARLRKRRIIYHGGPTNSGKTYQAIERLKKAGAHRQPGDGPAGLFCGPLRLLALEVYEQLNSQGVYCNLMTGQEKREVPFATHVSCTIEMASTENEYEVAVVDEIQMLADEQRGPSWTAAILGLNCPEIHVCGGMEGSDLVEAMAKEMGDDFELREYQRKTELVCAEDSLSSSYKNIQPGDAVVAFSRKDIFNIKREIESKTPHKCCVIFGSLPQETRAHQARLFNTEDTGYDVLVASDAIGMGLNLNIRRVVFHAVAKRSVGGGRTAVKLPPTVLKQIGGRAGRHGKQWEFGEVTCLRASDMPYMKQVMNTPLESLPKAAIFPSVQRMQDFSNCLDQVEPEDQERRRLAETYETFARKAKVGDRYFLGTHDQYQTLANTLHPIENLTLKERYAISMAPVNARNALLVRAIFLFASAHAAGLPVFINMQLPPKGVLPKSMSEFQTLCSKHNVLDLYRWMGVRFPSIECFAEKSVADIQRLELESIINEALKRKIAVAGPDSISVPEHDTFDKKMIRALNKPDGAAFSVTASGSNSVERVEDDDDGLEYQL